MKRLGVFTDERILNAVGTVVGRNHRCKRESALEFGGLIADCLSRHGVEALVIAMRDDADAVAEILGEAARAGVEDWLDRDWQRFMDLGAWQWAEEYKEHWDGCEFEDIAAVVLVGIGLEVAQHLLTAELLWEEQGLDPDAARVAAALERLARAS